MTSLEGHLSDLIAEDGFVRRLARRLVVDAATADDLAQDALVAALAKDRPAGAPLRGWLTVILRRLAGRARRGDARRARREAKAARPEPVGSTAELVVRESERRRVVDAVLALPEIYRTVVVERYFHDQSARAIAARLELPVETVRSRLKVAHEKLRALLGGDGPDGPAWFASLVPIACPTMTSMATALGRIAVTRTAGSLGTASWKVVTMSARTKSMAAALVLIVAAGVWIVARSAGEPARPTVDAPPSKVDAPASPAPLPVGTESQRLVESPPAVAPIVAVPFVERAPVGSVEIHTLRKGGGADVPHVMLSVVLPGSMQPFASGRRIETDAQGRARLEGVPAGKITASSDTGWFGEAEVKAGQRVVLTIEIGEGFTVAGKVVDADGRGVADADVCVGRWLREFVLPPTTRTDSAGSFVVSGLNGRVVAAARAAGYAPSRGAEVEGTLHDRLEVTLHLGPRGGSIAGRVLDADHRPASGATVTVDWSAPIRRKSPDLADGEVAAPSLTLCADNDGRFVVNSASVGQHRLMARTAHGADALAVVEVAAGATAEVEIVLPRGVVIEGRLVAADGTPAARASVSVGPPLAFWASATSSGDDGTFRLEGVRAGDIFVQAHHDRLGDASALFPATTDGATIHWDATLGSGAALLVRVVDEAGRALPRADVWINLKTWEPGLAQERMNGLGVTDAEGRVRFPNRAPQKRYIVNARVKGPAGLAETAVVFVADDQEHTLTIHSSDYATCFIAGRLVRADGSPVSSATMTGGNVREPAEDTVLTDLDGRFKLGPYRAGRLYLRASATGLGTRSVGEREVASGETWDVGDVPLTEPGTLVVTIVPAAGMPPPYLAEVGTAGTAHTEFLRVDSGEGRVVLAPGRYTVRVIGSNPAGADTDRSAVIEAGKETKVSISVVPGIRRDVVIKTPMAPTFHDPLLLTVMDAAGAVVCERVSRGMDDPGEVPKIRITVAPGRYRLVARSGAATGEAALEIPADAPPNADGTAAPPVEVVIEGAAGR